MFLKAFYCPKSLFYCATHHDYNANVAINATENCSIIVKNYARSGEIKRSGQEYTRKRLLRT